MSNKVTLTQSESSFVRDRDSNYDLKQLLVRPAVKDKMLLPTIKRSEVIFTQENSFVRADSDSSHDCPLEATVTSSSEAVKMPLPTMDKAAFQASPQSSTPHGPILCQAMTLLYFAI